MLKPGPSAPADGPFFLTTRSTYASTTPQRQIPLELQPRHQAHSRDQHRPAADAGRIPPVITWRELRARLTAWLDRHFGSNYRWRND